MILALLINRFGDSIDAIAFTWIVYELTENAVWSAVIFGANNVPSVFVTPLAGVWMEGRNKKRIMVVADLIHGVCVALIATFYLRGILQAWMLLASTLIISTAEAFRGPDNTALTPKLLKREYYEYGLSLHSTLSQAAGRWMKRNPKIWRRFRRQRHKKRKDRGGSFCLCFLFGFYKARECCFGYEIVAVPGGQDICG